MDPTIQAVLLSWNWRPDVLTVVAVCAVTYVTGWWQLRQRHPLVVPGWRLAVYLGGLAVVVMALVSPIDALGSLLFTAHMAQHELLTMVAPPLLLLGNPLAIALWAVPAAVRPRAGRLLLPAAWLRRALWALTLMPVAWVAYVATVWGWHHPSAYGASLRSDVVHDAQHLSFFLVALLFWWPIVDPAPRLHGHRHQALRLAYVVPAAFQSQALGFVFVFISSRVLYPHYLAVPRVLGLTPLQDQVSAGLLMMEFEGLVYLGVVLLLVAGFLRHEERTTLRDERFRLPPPEADAEPAP